MTSPCRRSWRKRASSVRKTAARVTPPLFRHPRRALLKQRPAARQNFQSHNNSSSQKLPRARLDRHPLQGQVWPRVEVIYFFFFYHYSHMTLSAFCDFTSQLVKSQRVQWAQKVDRHLEEVVRQRLPTAAQNPSPRRAPTINQRKRNRRRRSAPQRGQYPLLQ